MTTSLKQLLSKAKLFITDNTAARQSQEEMMLSSIGALAGIGMVTWVSHYIISDAGLPFIVASMGAAAVLLYAAPHSPLTQPWSFVGGHLVSAVVGVTCAQWVSDPFLASGLAVGLAIFAMHELNCLHPPGGAAALVAVVGGEQIHSLGYLYVLIPVGLNVLIMGAAVWLIRLLLAQRRQRKSFVFYNEEQKEIDISHASPFSTDDLKDALQDMDAYIDVSINDLNDIYARALSFSHRRHLGPMLCRDMMRQPVVTVEFGDTLKDAWSLMQQHGIKSLAVTNRARWITGIITVSDFNKAAENYPGTTVEARLRILLKQDGALSSSKPEVVGQIMTSHVISLVEDEPVSRAFAIFSEQRIGHIPIINHEQRLTGMLSRTEITAALQAFQRVNLKS